MTGKKEPRMQAAVDEEVKAMAQDFCLLPAALWPQLFCQAVQHSSVHRVYSLEEAVSGGR